MKKKEKLIDQAYKKGAKYFGRNILLILIIACGMLIALGFIAPLHVVSVVYGIFVGVVLGVNLMAFALSGEDEYEKEEIKE